MMKSLRELRELPKEEAIADICEHFGEDDYEWARRNYDEYGVDGLVDMLFRNQALDDKIELRRITSGLEALEEQIYFVFETHKHLVDMNIVNGILDRIEEERYKLNDLIEKVIEYIDEAEEKREAEMAKEIGR